jgi:hypothetical protein
MFIANDSNSKMTQENEIVNTNSSTGAGHDDWLILVLL